ncbi:MAG: CT398-like coiled coil hairpin domain-containing protein, partial [Acidimicrobiales bacterium]
MEDLFALQDEDVLTGQLKYRKARLPEADAVVAAESARVQISSEVADLRIERLDHARRQNRFEGEVAAVEARLAELDQRLYGSAITSPKEATTLQNEIASLRRRQNDLEGQVLEIMELVEPFDVRLEELAVASDAADEAIAAALVALAEVEVVIVGE